MIWGESHFNLKILLLPKLHARKLDALLLFSINNITLCCSQVFHSSLYRIESLSWIKPSEKRWGDVLCLMDYFTVSETIHFLCLLSTNVENKPYTGRRDFCFLPNSIEINSLLGKSSRNIGFNNKLLDYLLSSLMVQAAHCKAGGSSSEADISFWPKSGGGQSRGTVWVQIHGTLCKPWMREGRHCLFLEYGNR